MSDYTKVTIETDARGRLSINRVNDVGAGAGYGFCGPKRIVDHVEGVRVPVVINHTLDAEDGRELALCVRTLDEIHVPGLPSEWAQLATAQNYLRRTLHSLARCERNGMDEAATTWRARAVEQRDAVVTACRSLASALQQDGEASS